MKGVSLKKAVFTTVYVLEQGSPIIYVSHDMDDDWQFFGAEENIEESEVRIMLLGEILQMEPSIESLLEMPIGCSAHRKDGNSEWVVMVSN